MLHKPNNWKPSQKGETWQGYIIIFGKYDCPYADKRGRVFEHKYIWWKTYGNKNPILKGEVLHHINGNKKDNRIENLEKLNVKEHNHKHFFRGVDKKKYQREWRIKNKDYLNKQKKEWRKINAKKIHKVEAEYRKNNKDKIDLWNKRYREKNRIRLNKSKNEWYHRHKNEK